jgi:hypothetical protein
MAFCGGMAAVYSDVYGRPISTVLLMLLTLFWAVFYLALQDWGRAAMIHGLNFNGTQIPPEHWRLFRESILHPETRVQMRLAGTCDSALERDQMLVQANNGHRKLFLVSRVNPTGVLIFAIYVG